MSPDMKLFIELPTTGNERAYSPDSPVVYILKGILPFVTVILIISGDSHKVSDAKFVIKPKTPRFELG
jgi:hypothetical protein